VLHAPQEGLKDDIHPVLGLGRSLFQERAAEEPEEGQLVGGSFGRVGVNGLEPAVRDSAAGHGRRIMPVLDMRVVSSWAQLSRRRLGAAEGPVLGFSFSFPAAAISSFTKRDFLTGRTSLPFSSLRFNLIGGGGTFFIMTELTDLVLKLPTVLDSTGLLRRKHLIRHWPLAHWKTIWCYHLPRWLRYPSPELFYMC